MSEVPEEGAPDSTKGGVSKGSKSFFTRFKARLQRLRDSAFSNRFDAIDREYIEEGARTVTDADLDTIVERAEAIEERFRSDGPLGRLIEDGRLLLGLVRDVRRGEYRDVPVWTLSAVGFTLLYVLNPFDLVPDALPMLGLLDDAAVVSACLAMVEQDLYAYRTWRQQTQGTDKLPASEASTAEGKRKPE